MRREREERKERNERKERWKCIKRTPTQSKSPWGQVQEMNRSTMGRINEQ